MKRTDWMYGLLVGALLSACTAQSKDDESKTDLEIIPVTQLITRDTVVLRDYVTDIQAVRNVEMRARVSGFLDKIYVDEGQEVKQGQPLFRINDEEYRAEVIKAKSNLESAIAEAKGAELEVDRVNMMVEKKVISKFELDVANAKHKAAKARIEEARSALSNAQLRLSYTQIKAPYDGLVDRLPLKVGSLIDEGTLFTTVSDVKSIYAYFNVSESEYLEYMKLRKQDPEAAHAVVKLILADNSPYPYEGRIETMEGDFDNNTGSIAFRAKFPNPDKLLKHGSSGKVVLTNPIDNALLVPQKAVFEIQDKNYVFVVDSANQVKMRSFTPEIRLSHFYIVNAGLKEGDRIVYEGLQTVKDGSKIEPRMILMDELIQKASN
jgi:membrane fusion protein, multidrug efflux system